MRTPGEKEIRAEEVDQARQEIGHARQREKALMALRWRGRSWLLAAGIVSAVLICGVAGAAPASAAPTPRWSLDSSPVPAYLVPGDKEAQVVVIATNLGDATLHGSKPVTITDTLPAGLKVTKVAGHSARGPTEGVMSCPLPAAHEPVTCTYGGGLAPFESLEVVITVEVEDPKEPLSNEVRASGGEAPGGTEVPSASAAVPLHVGASTPYGIEKFGVGVENESGTPATQAGEHPFQMTTTLDFNQVIEHFATSTEVLRTSPALTKDVDVTLPRGLIGNPNAVGQCSSIDFSAQINARNDCGPDSAIGVAVVTLNEPKAAGLTTRAVPVFNLVPAPGEPARLGFFAIKVFVTLDTSVRTGKDYAVIASVHNATTVAAVLGTKVTIWGNPGDPSHDESRGWGCVESGFASNGEACTAPAARSTTPFLSQPTLCSEGLHSEIRVDSWTQPGNWKSASSDSPALEGCGLLSFDPALEVSPETQSASEPTGLNVSVKLPQESTLTAGQLAEADARKTTVALPQGVQLNPGASDGLLACSAGQFGFAGAIEASQSNNEEFSPDLPGCVDQSKVGTVRIKTPLLAHELEGSAFLGEQGANPFQPPLVLYLVAQDPVSGVLVKLAGHVTPDPSTGQLVSVFENTPPLPFESLNVHFFSGSRASVATPDSCGSYETTSTFEPWSGGEVKPSASFAINSGPAGSGCPDNPLPFSPGFQAGSVNNAAGAYTPFSVTIDRPDGHQAVEKLTMHLPTGLAAKIASVTPCAEAQAATDSCGSDSLIGHATEEAGLGGNPITLTAPVYLTGPYKGAPFGISVVTHAKAGPFDLGNVTVRSKIDVNPYTAAVTITSDPLPTILKGVPVQLKHLNVMVDEHSPGFQFNPTNCNPLRIDATLTGSQGTNSNGGSSFQVKDCAKLPFKPVFTAKTQAKTSKLNGASLTVRVTSGPGQANIGKTVVALPIQLPSRLTTIQKACIDKVFEANPASCPEGSNIGTATIHTPVFKNPLSGPAFLVSHGNTSFPDVEFVLQGEGLTIILDGATDIKKGITTSSFNALPDAPVTSFETVLPEGPHSALAANGDLCKQPLTMPTTLTGQNGFVIKQATKIAVTGCPKKKALTRAQKLAKALKACKKKHDKKKRSTCMRAARKKYGAKKAAKKPAANHGQRH
jgi:hypothetical protein